MKRKMIVLLLALLAIPSIAAAQTYLYDRTKDTSLAPPKVSDEDLAAKRKAEHAQLIVVGCMLTLAVGMLAVWYYYGDTPISRKRRARSDERKTLREKVSSFEILVAELRRDLARANAVIDDFISAMKDSVCFDRKVDVDIDGTQHVFRYVGSESANDGDGFTGFYRCPVCGEDLAMPEEFQAPYAELVEHLAICRCRHLATRDLGLGSRGADVVALRRFLISRGYLKEVTVPTERFGPLTKKALIAFQAANGLPATGRFGPKTRAFLNSMGDAKRVTPISIVTERTGS